MQPIIRYHARGFTLVELLVVITIISLLAGLLLPVLETAIRSAREIDCLNKFQQMNLALMSYIDDYNERFPTGLSVVGQLDYAAEFLWPYSGLEENAFRNIYSGLLRCPLLQPWEDCPYIGYSGTPNAIFTRQVASDLNACLVRTDYPAYAEYAMLNGKPFSSINAPSQLITYYHILPNRFAGYWGGHSQEFNPYSGATPPSVFLPISGSFWNIAEYACFWHADTTPTRGACPTLMADGHVEQNLYDKFIQRYSDGTIRLQWKK